MVTGVALVLFWAVPCICACPEELRQGQVKDKVYVNSCFGLTVPLPEKWTVASPAELETLVMRGSGEEADSSRSSAALMADLPLLYLSRYPLNYVVPFNPSFIVAAEKVAGNVREEEYLEASKGLMTASFLIHTFPRDIYTTTISEHLFYVLEVRLYYAERDITQKIYARRFDDHMVVLAVSYASRSKSVAEDIRRTLNGIEIDAPLGFRGEASLIP